NRMFARRFRSGARGSPRSREGRHGDRSALESASAAKFGRSGRMEKMRYPNRASLSPASRDAEVGSVTLASLFLTVVLVGAMIACLSIGVLWRAKMNLSLRLDRCVEKTALTLESIQSKIEASNTRMQVTRAAAIAASIPTAGASVR